MAGYNLKEGQYSKKSISDDEIWSVFSYAFSAQVKHDTSYKYGFLKAILDNLYNVNDNLGLTFDQLFSKFTEIYWNLVLKYQIRQKPVTKGKRGTVLENVLYDIVEKYHIADGVPFEKLTDSVMVELCHKVKIGCKQNVVGALFEDTKGFLYSFSKSGEWIQINPRIYEFLCRHKMIIQKMNYYEWAKYLEKINDQSVMDHLLTKIDESSFRYNLSIYRKILYDEFESKTCFYCGRKLSDHNIHVDHFIPWSFIKDDKLWNLVLACSTCNTSKSDKLANINYLDKIINRNDNLLIENDKNNDMKLYSDQNMRSIYYWAKLNGYNRVWNPKEIIF